MTIEIHGHIESLSTGPMTQIAVTIRIASARSQELDRAKGCSRSRSSNTGISCR